MTEEFDPYRKWLGIPPKDQPPHYYRLLAIDVFESDLDVIEHAADQRMAHLRSLQSGQHAALSQRLLNEISAARLCLTTADKKAAYDAQLRARLTAALPRATRVAPLPVQAPAESLDLLADLGPSGLPRTLPEPYRPHSPSHALPWPLIVAGALFVVVVLLVLINHLFGAETPLAHGWAELAEDFADSDPRSWHALDRRASG